MNLTTLSEKLSKKEGVVYWRSSKEKSGTINVKLPFESDDVDIISELVAINYLLTEKCVFGHNLLVGTGITLDVSKGAIKKIVLGKSSKTNIMKFSSFIPFLLQGITIKTHKKYRKLEVCDSDEFETINADIEKYTNTRLLIDAPAIGKVAITNHSVERYLERLKEESGEVKTPLRSLITRLTNPEICLVKLPEDVLKHKARKYGEDDNYSVWKHPSSTLNFGLTEKDGVYSLVTVFIKNQ
ncbi:hypothetical protein JCM30760_27090 [Thiomicrorhabdus hydrogeniphila]